MDPSRRRCAAPRPRPKPSRGLQKPQSPSRLPAASGQSGTGTNRPHPPIACRGPCPYFATRPPKTVFQEYPTMAAVHPNSFKARKTLKVGAKSYTYFSLKAVEKEVGDLSRLPFSLRVLLENLRAPRGRHHGQEGRHRGLRRLAEERRQVGQGDQLPPRPRADAGLHRRAGRGRPRRHARRHGQAGRRRQEDQPAGARSTS